MPRPADSPVGHGAGPEWVDRPERSSTACAALDGLAGDGPRPAGRAGIALSHLPLLPGVLAPGAIRIAPISEQGPRQRRAIWRTLFRHYHSFACVLLDRVFLLNDQFSGFDVRIHGAEIIDELIARQEGCVLLGAHLGSFEIARSAGRTRGLKLQHADVRGERQKSGRGAQSHQSGPADGDHRPGRVDSMLKVEAALARGGLVGMLSDRTPNAEGTVYCQFLGREARFPTGPIRLATVLRRPVALIFGLYKGGNRYEIHIERFARPTQLGGRGRDKAADQLLLRYVERLEHYCRLAPYNWFNFYDFWR